MTAEQEAPVQRPIERYINFINAVFESKGLSVPPDLSKDAQQSQLFMDVVDSALNQLPPRDGLVLKQCYGLDGKLHTLAEIGRDLPRLRSPAIGITVAGVRYLVGMAIRRFRYPQVSQQTRAFLVSDW